MAWRAVVRVLRSPVDCVTSVVLPGDCRACCCTLSDFTRIPVCPSCWNDLPQQSTSLCCRCGEDVGVSDFGEAPSEGILCRRCRLAPPAFEMALAHGVYEGTLRSLLHLLKYEGVEPVAERLGALIAAQLAAVSNLPESMLVVPVPLFKGRRK